MQDVGRRAALLRGTLSAGVVAILIVGCSETVDVRQPHGAAPTSATSSAPLPPPVDPARLDTGSYPTRPRGPLGTAGTDEEAALVEGRRLANHVVGPWEVDGGLTGGGHMPTLFDDAFASSAWFATATSHRATSPIRWLTRDQWRAVTPPDKYVVGVHSGRTKTPDDTLWNEVHRFADARSAAAAAAAIGEAALAAHDGTGASDGAAAQVDIPGHPEAIAATHHYDEAEDDAMLLPGVDDGVVSHRHTAVRSVVAHGPYVLVQQTLFPELPVDGLAPAVARIARTLDLQIPLADSFSATDSAALADAPIDPTGLLARTVPIPPEDLGVNRTALAVFEPRGALHFLRGPVSTAAAMDATGVDLVANGKATVYRASDGASAATLAQRLIAALDDHARPQAPVTGLPESRCLRFTAADRFHCVAAVDRYVVEADLRDLKAVRQVVSAQVAMLIDP
ncbi:DUF7373 family lipoprotein [Mycobacterium sp. NPDC050041]|uniref:DUF7373 family lipoprotein n=1 Tax=Mycobacterium sp. NPDC050041 TaxID=3364293 RepID=UPI003C2C95E8